VPAFKPLLALLILAPNCLAETLRVTTWNLQAPTGASTSDIRLQEAAAALKQISPDVILLQQVRDWKMCADLAQALQPDQYTIQICSAFREAGTGALSTQQVAIISKSKAYFSWSEAWRSQGEIALPGGFVFAALQVGGQRVGFFSVQPGAASAAPRGPTQRAGVAQAQARCVGQLLQQVASATNWGANRVQEFVAGATFNTGAAGWLAARDNMLRLLEAADFGDTFLDTPGAQRITAAARAGQPGATADYILIQPAGCAASPRVLSATVCEHYPVTCEVELDPARVASALASRAEALRAREAQAATRVQPAAAVPQLSTVNHQLAWFAAALGGIAVLAALIWILARRSQTLGRQTPSLLTAGADMPSSYTVVIGTRSATEAASTNAPPPPAPHPIIHIEAPGATHTQAETLRRRALAAEQRAERATAVIRAGLIPHLRQWLKQNLVRKLVADRSQLLETQQVAAHKAMAVEERLSRLEQQIQRQNAGYQVRIEELTRDLIVAKEENRELIRARIAQVKAEMEAARVRLMAQTEAGNDGGA
jgi:endonuclease/exonuclease/phosphatase family metal-dependent hydrolase